MCNACLPVLQIAKERIDKTHSDSTVSNMSPLLRGGVELSELGEGTRRNRVTYV